MAQQHGDRLTAVDASFVAQEGPTAHMHVGAVMIFDGPAPAYEDARRPRARPAAPRPALPPEARLPAGGDRPPAVGRRPELQPRVPRARHRAARAGLRGAAARARRARSTRRRSTAPSRCGRCGSCTAWTATASRSSPRPTTRSSTASRASTSRPCSSTSRRCRRRSSTRDGAVDAAARRRTASTWPRGACAGCSALPFEAAARALGAATRPATALQETREALEGLGEVVWAGAEPGAGDAAQRRDRPAPPARLGAARARATSSASRTRSAARSTTSCSASVAGALQKWLRSRGVRTEGLELRALVPVSIRARDEHHQLGNRIAAMRGPLPVYVEDPVARLQVVRHAMDGLKDSKQALGAEVLAGMQALAPPTIFAQASRLNFSTRLFNLLVTNVPGPAVPALRARARAAGPVPGRVPAEAARARRRDHVLRRRDGLRAARRLRRDAGPRAARRDARRERRGAARRGGRGDGGAGVERAG